MTFASGLGNNTSGITGVIFGFTIVNLEALESLCGDITCRALISFGRLYGIRGIRKAIRMRPHTHSPVHDGHAQPRIHAHESNCLHIDDEEKATSLAPWILFTIFVFGPRDASGDTAIPLLE